MERIESFADERLVAQCIHCGGATETRDHCPSRVLLDEPHPENLPCVPACSMCNKGFSLDEEYFACLVECARTGSIENIQRAKIRDIFEHSPALAARISQARNVSALGETWFGLEENRIRSVVLKLARGHAAYELSEPQSDEPTHVMIKSLHLLTGEARAHFESAPATSVWPEVGSRAMQRMAMAVTGQRISPWVEVQPGRYRYLATAEGAIMIRIVISEYLGCEIIWDRLS
jgi:hypothetical protein